ncbi:hypothetical protein AXK56_00750 [Tsukamurella pulmonis]|uniref:Uncharacterized protein n=1 Tax=Tsukamurella pulmonis TaxID=47312 RepID=A0A1H1F2U4_9ACTN|nr:DUF2231 domain-containing protein [Tsukamurella pulmonis]KXO91693.1 hypothetical protein AXK56_00750 [Tsukamurella pulmonis]SDQ95302.1 hypothetical protein SAMN04489765_2487 [Tsukamurella pulmonis]SUP20164.1 Uncharacterised protein [Tsukamurella pulmonis]
MLTEIAGIPSHPLLVHGAVVLVPLAALALALAAWWPAARARLGVGLPVLALVATGACLLAKLSGEQLEQRPSMEGIRTEIAAHATQGNATFYWSLGLLLFAVLVWAGSSPLVAARFPGATVLSGRGGSVALGVLATATVVACLWGTVAAGHSGATMVWSGI